MGCINMINTNFDLNALKMFIAVYENKGIDKASKKLFITQPAVSIAIKKLEARLGGALFTRLPKGIVPTEEGERFYVECIQGLNLLSNAVENFSPQNALQEGSLKIGASTSMISHIIMPALKEFCALYPNIKVSFTEVIASRLERYLMRGELDIAFMEEPTQNIKLYDAHKIGTLNNCFVVSKDFKKDTLTKEEMTTYNYAVLKKHTNHRDYFEKLCSRNNLPLNVSYEMASFETLTQICESNLAVGFVIEEFIERELKTHHLKKIKTEIILPQSNVFALLPKGNTSGYVCKTFLNFFKEKYEG